MPRFAAVLLLLLCACASSSKKLVDDRLYPCGPGEDIDIQAFFAMPQGREMGGRMNVTMTVNVFNTSDHEIDVARISVEPVTANGLVMERGYREFDETIAEGEEKNFEIPMSATMPEFGSQRDRNRTDLRSGEVVALAVKITLGNGDNYLCRYSLGR